MARIDVEDTTEIDEVESDMVCSALSGFISKVDALIISDYAKGFLTTEIVSYLIRAGREAGKSVLVDPKGKDFSKYAGASILTPNRREAAAACDIDELSPDAVQDSGRRLLTELDLQAVLITEGEHGMTLFRSDDTFHVDAAAHQVFDVTGAGDTVIATLGVAIAAGFDLRTAVELANGAAGIAVGKVGTATIQLAYASFDGHLRAI